MYSVGRYPPGESPIRKICTFARGQISRADRRENLHDGRALSIDGVFHLARISLVVFK